MAGQYDPGVTALRSGPAKLVLAGGLPAAVSASWIPWRDQVPGTDLALLLVLVVAALGWLAGTRPALISAVAAAFSFDVLDTRPYGTLTISRGADLATALTLLITGLLVGAGAARLARYRKSDDERTDALAVVMEASGLVATGEQHQLITEALREELIRTLELLACEFHPRPPSGARPTVARDGSIVGLLTTDSGGRAAETDLPVWCQGDVVAHYRLTPGSRDLSQPGLRVALSLADQAGAAMSNVAPGCEPPPRPGRLRLVEPGEPPTANTATSPSRGSGKANGESRSGVLSGLSGLREGLSAS